MTLSPRNTAIQLSQTSSVPHLGLEEQVGDPAAGSDISDHQVAGPPHVGAVHVLRHSGALERLKDTGNPQALQEQLGHTTAEMTLRYPTCPKGTNGKWRP